jgi:hypothetical protein
MTITRRKIMVGLLIVLLTVGAVGVWIVTASAGKRVNTNLFGVAVKGYDTVAYYTRGEAVRGSGDYESVWDDVRWRFSSAEHRDLFAANPDRYAPQYGGFCASYLTEGGMAGVNPEAWAIVEGKLYLNWSEEGRDEFVAGGAESIRKADANWAQRQAQM